MTKQVLSVSIDAGNSLVKGVRHHQAAPVCFPNLVASERNNHALADFAGFTSSDPLLVEMDTERWAVGYAAQELSKRPRSHVGYSRYDSADFPALVAGLLGELYPVRGGEVALTFSLPVDGFGEAATQIERLAGRWSFKCRRSNLTFDLPADLMLALPESFGSVCYYLLSADGSKIVDVPLSESRIAVIDIGGYTTDLLTFRELALGPVRGSTEIGVLQVQADVNGAIKHQFNRPDLERRDLETVIRTGEYWHRGKAHDVREIVEAALWDLSQDVLDIWNDPHKGLAGGLDIDCVIFTGGGAPLIRPYLESAMQSQGVMHHNVKRVPDDVAHLANAIGAYRFAAFRRQHGQL